MGATTISCLFAVLVSTTTVLCQNQPPASAATCYDGLFFTPRDLEGSYDSAQAGFQVTRLYKLNEYEVKYTMPESCGQYLNDMFGTTTLLPCRKPNYISIMKGRRKRDSHCEACCNTVMSISLPTMVEDVYTGTMYSVKHFATSTQLLQLGHCSDPDGACGYGGTCIQMYRIQFVLITINGSLKFVPVSVPSHCSCQYY